jgi:hypothetical protein
MTSFPWQDYRQEPRLHSKPLPTHHPPSRIPACSLRSGAAHVTPQQAIMSSRLCATFHVLHPLHPIGDTAGTLFILF